MSECFGVKNPVNSDFALHQFNKTARFKSNKYDVKFPVKETQDTLGDNYLNCKRGLKNLTQKLFLNNPDLLNECNKIINEQLNLDIIENVNNLDKIGETIVTRNGKIVWKHGPNWPFYAVMLRTKLY